MKQKKYTTWFLRFLVMLIGIIFLTAGSTLGIIAGLGQTTSTGTSSALGTALHIRVGHAMFLLYGMFFLLQLALLGKEFHLTRLIQMVPVCLNAEFLNFFRYSFPPFLALHPERYPERFLVFLIGMLLISLGFTVVRCSEFSNYPPESFCVLLAERLRVRFGTVKIGLDFVYVAASLLICLAARIRPDMVREGTLIFAVCNGLLINFYMPFVRRITGRIPD